MNKIAISCHEPRLDGPVDPRFGRAAGFLIVDPETMTCDYRQNGQAQTMARGAGIQAAETIIRAGAKVVLTGYVGPKAFQALSAGGVRIVRDLEGMTVRQAVERYRAGDFVPAETPSSRGHSGGGRPGAGMGGGRSGGRGRQ